MTSTYSNPNLKACFPRKYETLSTKLALPSGPRWDGPRVPDPKTPLKPLSVISAQPTEGRVRYARRHAIAARIGIRGKHVAVCQEHLTDAKVHLRASCRRSATSMPNKSCFQPVSRILARKRGS